MRYLKRPGSRVVVSSVARCSTESEGGVGQDGTAIGFVEAGRLATKVVRYLGV